MRNEHSHNLQAPLGVVLAPKKERKRTPMAWLMGQVQPKLTCTRKADQGGYRWCRAGSVRGAAGEVRCLGRSRRRQRQTIWCAVRTAETCKRCIRRRTAVAETPSLDRRAAHGGKAQTPMMALVTTPSLPVASFGKACKKLLNFVHVHVGRCILLPWGHIESFCILPEAPCCTLLVGGPHGEKEKRKSFFRCCGACFIVFFGGFVFGG